MKIHSIEDIEQLFLDAGCFVVVRSHLLPTL